MYYVPKRQLMPLGNPRPGCFSCAQQQQVVRSFGEDPTSVWDKVRHVVSSIAGQFTGGTTINDYWEQWLVSKFGYAPDAPPSPQDIVAQAQQSVATGQLSPDQGAAMINAAAELQKQIADGAWGSQFQKAGSGLLSGVEGLLLLAVVGGVIYFAAPLLLAARPKP